MHTYAALTTGKKCSVQYFHPKQTKLNCTAALQGLAANATSIVNGTL